MQEKILSIIRARGPVLPVVVAKAINSNILIASAHLSELVHLKKIFLSHTKIGGSPVYYLKGQEPKLQGLYQYLNEKEKQAFSELKQKKVLKDSTLLPLMRVSLRNIKDFAVPINVRQGDRTELFWKWYLIPNEGVAELITPQKKPVEQQKIPQQKQELKTEEGPVKKPAPEQQKISLPEPERKKPEIKKTEQRPVLKKQKQTDENLFLQQIKLYLNKKDIQILRYDIIKKEKEINLMVEVPSAVGHIEYFCKAKKKGKISDLDLNAVFVEGQLRKKPVLFLTTGKLSKKSETRLANEFKGMIINKIN